MQIGISKVNVLEYVLTSICIKSIANMYGFFAMPMLNILDPPPMFKYLRYYLLYKIHTRPVVFKVLQIFVQSIDIS